LCGLAGGRAPEKASRAEAAERDNAGGRSGKTLSGTGEELKVTGG